MNASKKSGDERGNREKFEKHKIEKFPMNACRSNIIIIPVIRYATHGLARQ
jgi:hypothetical protein